MKLQLDIAPDSSDDDIDITPLIDCVFLLVLFFMLTSSFIEEAKVYKISLPRANDAVTIDRAQAESVTVTLDGRYFYRDGSGEKEVANLEVLERQLRDRDDERKKKPMILRCDARCEYRQFVQIKNVLKLAGVETVFEEVEVRGDQAQP
jgi:biopolymer transport protein ExbD